MTGKSDHIVAELAARIFADLADPQTINRARNGAWKAPFWRHFPMPAYHLLGFRNSLAALALVLPMASPC